MPKNIILCSDGTGNSGGQGNWTNVWRMFKAVRRDGNVKQIAFHDDGVGTQDLKVFKAIGGAFGWGLSRNVRELYTELIRNYEPGDKIYLFGFSRGAFTVRTLAGLIAETGIIDAQGKSERELKGLVKKAFSLHRRSYPAALSWLAHKIVTLGGILSVKRDDFLRQHALHDKDEEANVTERHQPRIRFMGVWDTVAAVGFPVAFVAELWNLLIYRFSFPDCKLSPQVEKGCHALAIDDERQTFHPTLWDQSSERDKERIQQVWFAGVHSNVGGGYPKEGLAYVTLDWMFTHAADAGMELISTAVENAKSRANVFEQLYDSRSGVAVYYRYKPRDIATISASNGIDTPCIHSSVFQRINAATQGYAPGNLPSQFQLVSTADGTPPASASELSGWFEKTSKGQASLVSQIKLWKYLRMASHFGLFGVSALIVFWNPPSLNEGINQALLSLFRSLVLEPKGLMLILVLGVAYGIGLVAKSNQKRFFSSFWSGRKSN